ncbi:hypothetical protein TRFO_42472 [Tritrichomonas foetus]|uniref:VPS9 domain-containing protein n=1 Tax=Tritrichomonas foetus TaxID=1144522 RepID=A0A1J4KWH2_9EUKA|nr:hypothetical protein TRFO_42472 [Tritrichomonas foetus]|eukprot:OHT15587.1 hypothetical protein TRFO_42472 [Tritrichomonas foetus]
MTAFKGDLQAFYNNMYQTQRLLHGEEGFSRHLQNDVNKSSAQRLVDYFEAACKQHKGYYALWSLISRDKPKNKNLDLPRRGLKHHPKSLLVILDANSIPLKEETKKEISENIIGGNLKENIIDKLPDLKDERLISTIVFGIIPSYYSFFIHEQQFEDFLDFLDLFEDDKHKIIFSAALFCSPIVVSFIHDVFSPIFLPFCQALQPLCNLNIHNIQKQLLNSLNTNIFNFPTTLKHFINHFYNSDKEKQKKFAFDLLKTNLFKKIIQFPEAFQVFEIGLLEFHPETKEICQKMKKIFNDEFISQFLDIILEIKVNNTCYVSKECDQYLSNAFSMFLDSFDLAFIDFAEKYISNEKEDERPKFDDYFEKVDNYCLIKIKRSSSSINLPYNNTQFFGSYDLFYFRKLLKESPPLPRNYQVPKKMNVKNLIKRLLVQTNDPFTSGKAKSYFNIIKNFDSLIETNLKDLIFSHDEEQEYMCGISKSQNEITRINSFIQNQLISTPKDTITNFAFLIALRKVEFGDIPKQIHKIVHDPRMIRVDFRKFHQNAINNVEKLGFSNNESVQAKMKILNYLRFFSHNRFIEYIGQRPELIENDKILSSIISSNYHNIIKTMLITDKQVKLFKQIIPNFYIFEIPAQHLRNVFSENIDPFTKLKKIDQSIKMAKEICTREFGDIGEDDYTPFSQIFLAYSNPPNLLSNYVFLLDYIFDYKELPEANCSRARGYLQHFLEKTISQLECITVNINPYLYSPIFSANIAIIINGYKPELRNSLVKYIVQDGGCQYDEKKSIYSFQFHCFDKYSLQFHVKCRVIRYSTKDDLQDVDDDEVLMLYDSGDENPMFFSSITNDCKTFFESFKGQGHMKTIHFRKLQYKNTVTYKGTEEIHNELKKWFSEIEQRRKLL